MTVFEYFLAQPVAFTVVVGILGLLVGSFLNVVILRLPVMMDRDWRAQCAELLERPGDAPDDGPRFDLVVPRSRCPHCGRGITALENVPLLSYAFLRGRCAGCRVRIPLRYPAVEALTGLLSAVVAWHFGFGLPALGGLLLTWALVALTFIDLDHQLLPDSITLPWLWLGIAFSLGGTFTGLESSVLGAMAGYGLLWLVFQGFRLLTGKEGMGYGDFKLLALLGAWLGWEALPGIVLLSSLVGAVAGVSLVLLRGHDRSVPIPFGPYLAAAGWLYLVWGDEMSGMYLRWTGLA